MAKWTFPRLAVGFEVAKPSIKSLQLDELTQHMSAQGAPSYRARQITDWLYEKRVANFAEMTDLPAATRVQLAKDFSLNQPEVVRVLGSKDTTQKFLFRLRDQNLIESVLIPASPALYGQPSDRRTICVSTQVGCAYGCKFCASGLEGWTRNLDAGEIVQQLIAIEEKSGEKIDNVVFMGMGEPLANLKNLLRAIRIINAPWGLGIGARHITVSTSGLAPQIRELANEPTQFRLALSLHGATDEVRGQIMPVNRKYPPREFCSKPAITTSRKKEGSCSNTSLSPASTTPTSRRTSWPKSRAVCRPRSISFPTTPSKAWIGRVRLARDRKNFYPSCESTASSPPCAARKATTSAAACGQLRLQTKRAEADPAHFR